MTLLERARIRRLCLVALVLLGLAAAASILPGRADAATPSAVQTFSVEASSTSVRSGSAFGYTVTVRMRRVTPSLRVRLRIYTSGGWLLYQKTEYVTPAKQGSVRVSLERPATEPEIEPGTYRAEITVKSTDMTEPIPDQLPLRVYSSKRSPVPVVVAIRVSGPPMTDPQGRFVVDPADPNAAFEAAVTTADLVLSDARVRLSLALSPVLLSEWRDLTDGYELIDETGVTEVTTASPTPARYAQGLDRLRAAAATGRLELLALGYADPNLSWLNRHGLLADIKPQYALGTRETSASLEATPVPGTALAGSCLPPIASAPLVDAGVRWVVVEQDCVSLGKGTATTGVYRTQVPALRALVVDSVASKRLRAGDTSRAVERAFARFLGDANRNTPYILAVDAGPGMTEMSVIADLVEQFVASPWARFTTTRQAFSKTSASKVTLKDLATPDRAPAGYWEEVSRARDAARSLSAALGPTSPDALKAQLDGLVAESSGFAGADRSWAFADRGRAFSAAASRRAKLILGGVRLSAPDVTLSGSAGEVPVTITNPTRRVLRVVFIALDSERVVRSGGRRELLLRPGDTYLTLKVDLRSSISSTLRLAVRAGGTNIDTDAVVVRASYLDRLAIIGGVLALLVGFLVWIVMRVRAAETTTVPSTESPSPVPPPDAVDTGEARYTEQGSGEHDPGVSDTP
jgi:hypothetical protein